MTESGAPETIDQLFERLRVVGDSLPKRLRQCAEYVAANSDRIAVSTVAELSKAADVQPSAFVRFCQELGFDGYSQMQKLFRSDYTPAWPDYGSRLAKLREQNSDSPMALLAEFVDAGHASLESLVRSINPDALDHAIAHLCAAQTIHIVGYRRVFPVASYLHYAFEKMNVPSILHSGIGGVSSEHMFRADDALIAITFASYSQETIDLAQSAERAGMKIIAITDKPSSPLLKHAKSPLLVSEVDAGSFRTLSAIMSLAVTMAVAVGTRREVV